MEVIFPIVTIWEFLVAAKVISMSLKLVKYFKSKKYEDYLLFRWSFQLLGYSAPVYICLTIIIQVLSAEWLIIEAPKHPADYAIEMAVKSVICLVLTFVSWQFTYDLSNYDFERRHHTDDDFYR